MGKIVMWTLGGFGILFAVLFGISLMGNVASTASSVATAPGRVIQRTMETSNIISTYEGFHDRWKGYESRLAQIVVTSRDLNAETDPSEKVRLRVELNAQRQSCRDIASRYNSDAAKTNRSIFMGRDAPPELNMASC
jgi:hypothetical protein